MWFTSESMLLVYITARSVLGLLGSHLLSYHARKVFACQETSPSQKVSQRQ